MSPGVNDPPNPHPPHYATEKTAASIFTVKTNEITRKHLILCSSVSDKWQKTLKTPKKVGGPVGKEGVLSGVNRL